MPSSSDVLARSRTSAWCRLGVAVGAALVVLAASFVVPEVAVAADGRADTGFGAAGVATVHLADGGPSVGALTVQPDGGIVLTGSVQVSIHSELLVARLRADGTLDPSFGTGGVARNALASSGNFGRGVTVLPSGKIVVAFAAYGTDFSFGIARYEANGSLDTTFGTNGFTITDIGPGTDEVLAMAVQPDGKYVLVGSTQATGGRTDFAVARYTTAGVLDPSFGTGGIATATPAAQINVARAVAVRDDGTIVVAGSASATTPNSDRFTVARFTGTGALDPSFDGDGMRVLALGTDVSRAHSVLAEPHGHVIAGGFAYEGVTAQGEAVRFAVDGSLDLSYAGDGSAELPNSVVAMVRQRDGKVLAASTTTAQIRASVVRLTIDGVLDAGFGAAGVAATGFDADNRPTAIALQNDGAAVLAVDISGRSPQDIGVMRLRPAAPGLTVVAPSRVLDTRGGARPAAGTITRVATGAPAGTTAALVNLTMTDATTAGYITADRCSTLTAGPQTKSNGNYAPAQNIANTAVIPLDPDGTFCIYNETPVHLLADVQGTY